MRVSTHHINHGRQFQSIASYNSINNNNHNYDHGWQYRNHPERQQRREDHIQQMRNNTHNQITHHRNSGTFQTNVFCFEQSVSSISSPSLFAEAVIITVYNDNSWHPPSNTVFAI